MARILYGVAGEGSGHATRARIIIEHLLSEGHEVKIVSYDRGFEYLSKYFSVDKITGFNLRYEHNAVQYIKTAIDYLSKLPQSGVSLNKILKITKKFKPHLIITDFEPLTANVAGIRSLPLVSIDNQHVITNTTYSFPVAHRKNALLIKNIIKLMVPRRANYYLVTSFFKPTTVREDTFLFPPILRDEIRALSPTIGAYILVYITSEDKRVLEILAESPLPCVVYGFKDTEKSKGNYTIKTNGESFLKDLAGCKAIIATAGSSLIGEALYLGKPYLALPIAKQFEQTLNAHYIEKLEYGMTCEHLNPETVHAFIEKIPLYTDKLKHYPREDNSKLFAKLDELVQVVASTTESVSLDKTTVATK